jgi:hypothetical protein
MTKSTAAPDITQLAINASKLISQQIEDGATNEEVLTRLALLGEAIATPGSVSSILVLDENGLLRNGASPNLPADYLNAIDKIKPDENVGTCASAAATGKMVITLSFLTDEKWAELRHLPMGIGFKSAWSMPIKCPKGNVVGTFGTYFKDCRAPSAQEQQSVEILAKVAGLALARQ